MIRKFEMQKNMQQILMTARKDISHATKRITNKYEKIQNKYPQTHTHNTQTKYKQKYSH